MTAALAFDEPRPLAADVAEQCCGAAVIRLSYGNAGFAFALDASPTTGSLRDTAAAAAAMLGCERDVALGVLVSAVEAWR